MVKARIAEKARANGTKTKQKPKSIKSAHGFAAHRAGSKRRLSRFGKKQLKGGKGSVATFMTRTRAIKKLQITLRDFRRLCILKGIYPREPKKKAHGSGQTYYHVKDVQYLSHEPLLDKFREFKAFMRKVHRAIGREEHAGARKMYEERPRYRLDHLLRERYPRFGDAINDLDDGLSMAYLFASLPSIGRIESKRTALCLRLCREWENYVARSRCLRKTFLSVKGIYYQAVVDGQPVTWLVPYKFSQRMPSEVDFRVMLTFLEFYEILLQFVMLRLYSGLGLRYPPVVQAEADAAGAHLTAIALESLDGSGAGGGGAGGGTAAMPAIEDGVVTEQQKKSEARLATLSATLAKKSADDDEDDDDSVAGDADEEGGVDSVSKLFEGFRFFCSREVPREAIEFTATSFGGQVGWEGDGSPFGPGDATITHWVTDRPRIPDAARVPGREVVQPQWLFDSVNAAMVLPVSKYGPNADLPPHLSPFVDDAKEGYIPAYRQELDRLRSAAAGKGGDLEDDDEEDDTEDEIDGDDDEDEEEDEDEDDGEPSDDEDGEELAATKRGAADMDGSDSEADDSEEEEEAPKPAKRSRKQGKDKAQVKSATRAAKKQAADKEKRELAEMMMTKKKKRQYTAVMRAKGRVAANAEKLEQKRKQIEETKAKKSAPKRRRR